MGKSQGMGQHPRVSNRGGSYLCWFCVVTGNSCVERTTSGSWGLRQGGSANIWGLTDRVVLGEGVHAGHSPGRERGGQRGNGDVPASLSSGRLSFVSVKHHAPHLPSGSKRLRIFSSLLREGRQMQCMGERSPPPPPGAGRFIRFLLQL